ncbi:MAG: hypothetical protein Q3988_05650 [Gemella sp.]|nr:hypothetical protein [Gemella sp.]
MEKLEKEFNSKYNEYINKFGDNSLEYVNFYWYSHYGIDEYTEHLIIKDIEMLDNALKKNKALNNVKPIEGIIN